MKYLTILFNNMYWFAAAFVPLLPVWVLRTYDSTPACDVNGVCFHFAYLLNTEGEAISALSVLLLWPMCVWQIALKHVRFA